MNHVIVTAGVSEIRESLVRRLVARGVRVSVVDSTDATTTAQAINDANATGPVDAFVICAGAADRISVLESEPEQFARTMTYRAAGMFAPAQAFARLLVGESRPGAIVTVVSTASLGHVAGLGAADHASASAIVGLTRSLSADLAQHGIRVNGVAAGPIRTQDCVLDISGEEQLAASAPAGRLAEPDEVAAAIEWLLSSAASFITGHILPVEGGQASVSVPPVNGHLAPFIDTRNTGAL